MPERAPVRLREYRRTLPFLRPYALPLAGIIGLSIISTGAGLLGPLVNQQLIDKGLIGRDPNALLWTAGAMAGLAVFGFLTNAWSSYTYAKISARVLFAMRLELYEHLQRISPRHHARARMGDFISRLNNDVAEVQRVSADTILALMANVVFLVGAVVLMLGISPRLFLLSIVLLPVALWASRRAQHKLAAHVKRMRERSSTIGSFLIESLTGLRLTVLANAQRREVERFGKHNQSFVDAMLAMQMTSLLAGAIPTTAVTLSTAAVFLAGGWEVLAETMTLGTLVAFLAYHGRLLSPVQNLMSLYGSLVTGAVSLRRMFELLEIPIEVQEPAEPVAVAAWRGELTVENVTFGHNAPVLRGASMHLEAGKTYVLTGASGAGKSTLVDLLVRLYDPGEGVVRLDGQDVRRIPLAVLRQQIAVIEQTPILFHGTVGENIAYSRPEASDSELAAAARAAALELPLETEVGERGSALSAGERQRVAIARALLRDPRVLILDEPVAALDGAARGAIRQTLERVLTGRTGLIISHEAFWEGGEALELMDGQIRKVACPSV
jgi:ATP-binding cassette, subfamily B, bacterial